MEQFGIYSFQTESISDSQSEGYPRAYRYMTFFEEDLKLFSLNGTDSVPPDSVLGQIKACALPKL